MAAASSASSSASGGSSDGSRCASIDLPVPGAPMSNSEWPPAAAISSTRLACGCPRTSARSGSAAGLAQGALFERRQHGAAGQVPTDGQQRIGGMHHDVAHQRGFAGGCRRQHERAAVAARAQHHGERAADGAQLAGQRELAGELVALERRRGDLPGGREDAQGDRQIEAPRFLGQIGRREIDRDTPRRKFELRILQRGAHAIARFAHLGVGQADEVERRKSIREVDLDFDGRRRNACQCATTDHGDIPRMLEREPVGPYFNLTPPGISRKSRLSSI